MPEPGPNERCQASDQRIRLNRTLLPTVHTEEAVDRWELAPHEVEESLSSPCPRRANDQRSGLSASSPRDRPPSFTGVDNTPSVISAQMGRGAPDQAECDFSKIVS